MRATDGQLILAAGTGASATFRLCGGRYQFSVAAATFGGGNVALQQLGCDGATWLPVATAITAVGVNVFEAPAGSFRFFVTTSTGVAAAVSRIPGE